MHRHPGARRRDVAPAPCIASLAAWACLCGVAALPAWATDEPHAHEHEHGEQHDDMEVIVVTASPLAHEADELALPVDQLDRDQIVDQLSSTIGDTLRNLPGLASSGFSAGASRPVIRGQDAFRTEVLESGLSTQDVSRLSPDHAVPVNPLSAQFLEVVRGPGVLRYGGGASAGVVNAITNRVPRDPIAMPLEGELVAIYGDNADERDLAALLEGGVLTDDYGDFAWHFDTLLRKSDDYHTGSRGRQDGTETDAFAASGGAAWFAGGARLGLAYSRFENDYGIPEEGEPVEIDMHVNRVQFDGDWLAPAAGVRKVELRGVYSEYRHDEKVEGVVGQRFANDEFDGRLELLHEPLLGFVGAAGVHGKFQDLKARGEAEEFLAPSETGSFALYVFEERPLARHLDLELGFRAEAVRVEGTPIDGRGRDRHFAPLSGSAALVAHPWAGWRFALTGTAGQRAPSQVELYARGPHEATGTFEVGDPGLDEETSYNGELRVGGAFSRVDVELAAFATHYRDFIYGRLTGVRVDEEGNPGDDLDELFYEERNALFYGGEAELGIALFEAFGVFFTSDWQMDFVRARFTDGDGNRNLPRIPPIRWGGRLRFEHERFEGYLGFLRTEAQHHGAENEFETGAFTMLDLGAKVRLPWFEAIVPLELAMTARNLLDQNARNAVSFKKDEVLLPGRSLRFSIHARF